jgi:hypothetical protein
MLPSRRSRPPPQRPLVGTKRSLRVNILTGKQESHTFGCSETPGGGLVLRLAASGADLLSPGRIGRWDAFVVEHAGDLPAALPTEESGDDPPNDRNLVGMVNESAVDREIANRQGRGRFVVTCQLPVAVDAEERCYRHRS